MSQPNIVFILIDDMGWMDLGCYGSSFYETPNLDRLARQGMRMTHGYAAAPLCSPTRASILTGKYPATVQITNYIFGQGSGKLLSAPYLDHLPTQETTIAAALGQGGYQTWHVGKWHLGGQEKYWPENHGFDVNIGGWRAGRPESYFPPYHNPRLPDGPEGEYLTDRLTDEAIGLIDGRDPDRPFFLNMCYYAVHTPIQAKDELIAKYRAKARALGLDQLDPMEIGEPFPCLHKQGQNIIRRKFQSDPVYAAMIQTLDENIGRLMDTLDAQGLAEDTLVIFTSDNGGLSTAEGSPTCNAPLSEGKGWMYEGGNREPMIFRWPGKIAADSICDQYVTSPDFYPTLLEWAQLEPMPDQHSDGVSLVKLLTEGVDDSLAQRPVFWHYPHYSNQGDTPSCAVRKGPWKLIEWFEDNHIELYNVVEDVGETNDQSAHKPQLVEQLSALLHEWLESSGAKIPQPNPERIDLNATWKG
ncbi:MAG: sulfatase [Phycisphaerae bacterium]